VFRRDEAYCCTSCAQNQLCSCFTEVDLANDGVEGLGLAFEPTRIVERESTIRLLASSR
jgi:hypothetical protein